MNERIILTGQEARTELKKGIDALANLVGATLGPKGRPVVMGIRGGAPVVSDDGVSIAEQIFFDEEIKDLGVRILREASKKTDEIAGDGTTTSIVLGQALVDVGMPKGQGVIGQSNNSVLMRDTIREEVKEVVSLLKDKAVPVETFEEMKDVAFTASKDEKIADTVAKAYEVVGKNGFVDFKDGYNEIVLDVTDGFKLESGFAERFMVNTPQFECVLEGKVPVLVTNFHITDVLNNPNNWLAGLCKNIIEKLGKKSLVIIAEAFSDDARTMFLMNRFVRDQVGKVINSNESNFHILAIPAPYMYQDFSLEDLATYCGGTYIKKDIVPESITTDSLGWVEKVVARKEDSAFFGGSGDVAHAVKKLVSERDEFEKSEHFRGKIQERIGRLQGKIATIKIGAPTETEKNSWKEKVQDAVRAVKGAIQEGVVKGGGLALKEIAETKDWKIKSALLAPYRKIQENAGGELVITDNIKDPLIVVRTALENASSVASLVITAEGAINHRSEVTKRREQSCHAKTENKN